MGIFLNVLKIIGIVLLCILAFLLLVFLLVMLVPYRYRVHGEKKEGISAFVKVTWLLHFVVVLLTYDTNGLNLRLKILGICFYDKKKKAEKKKLKEEKQRLKDQKRSETEEKRRKKKKPLKEEDVETVYDKTAEAASEDDKPLNDKPAEEVSQEKTEDKNEETSADKGDKKDKEKKKKPFLQWLEEVFDKAEDMFDTLPDLIEQGAEVVFDKLEAVRQKVTDIFETIEYYHRLLGSEGAEWVYEHVKKHFIGILKAVRPTRFDCELNIADDDPAAVAKVYEYEVYALPLIELIRGKRGEVLVNAYQDDKYFDLDATLKGRVLLTPLAWHGLAIILNKKVKAFIKRLKREEVEEKKKNG